MRIYKPIGSKDRLVEIFQNVNKVKLNEGLYEAGSPNLNADAVLNMAYNDLKSGKLKPENTNTETTDNGSFTVLTCIDRQGNNITFTFKMSSTEGDQQGVYNVSDTTLNAFSFDSADGEDTIELGEDGLVRFNQQYGKELFDVVSKFANVGEPIESDVQEAIDLIDAIKPQSYPFGGSPKDMQTGSGYADQKPTNTSVRVKSPELDQYIQEDMNSIIQNLPGPSGAKALYPQAADMGVTNQYILRQSLWKEIGVELLNIVPLSADKYRLVTRFEGENYNFIINKNYGSADKVIKLIKKRLDTNHGTTVNEIDKPAMKLIQQAPGGASAGGVKQLEERMKLPIVGGVGMGVSEVQMVGTETLGEPKPINPSTKSPVDDLPPEKRKIIMDAINSLTKFKPDFAPSADQINAEILRLRNQPQVKEGSDVEDADVDTELKRFYKEKELSSQHPEQISAPEEVPVEEPEMVLSQKDIDLIYQAEANLMAKNARNRNYSPTTDEIRAEMDNIKGIKKPMKKFRSISKEAEPYLSEDNALINVKDIAARGLEKVYDTISPTNNVKSQIIQAADELVNMDLGVKRFQITPEQYRNLVKTVALAMYMDYAAHARINEDEKKPKYPKEHKNFKPKKQYKDKENQKKDTTIKLDEDINGMSNVPDLTGEKELEAGYDELMTRDTFQKLSDAYSSLLNLSNEFRSDPKIQETLSDLRDVIAQYCQMSDMHSVTPEDVQNFFENTLKETVDYEDDDIANLPDVPSGHGAKMAAKRDMGSVVKPVEEPVYEDGKEETVPTSMEGEPENDEIEQLAQDKEEQGEILQGGVGDGKSPTEFSPDQILAGMMVEKEHTDDPLTAIEIVIDHLTEDPEYYTEKDTPEASAQAGASADASSQKSDDKNLEDVLLGYKPHNVGDEVEGEEEIEEPVDEETTTVSDMGSRFQSIANAPRPETPMVQEDNEKELKDRDPASWHQIQIAKKTLKMPGAMAGVMGGMSKEEAKQILTKRGIKFDEK